MGALPKSRRVMAVIVCVPLLVAIGCREKVASPLEPIPGPPPVNLSSDTRIAFVSTRDGSPYIYVANADGSGLTRLAPGERPAWSPDGRQIAFDGIFVMNADGSNLRRLTAGFDPSWSPDGGSIVFNTSDGGGVGIYVVKPDGTGLTRLLSSDYALDLPAEWGGPCTCSPTWSPDGKRIAFIRETWDFPWQIHVMNADGSGPKALKGSTEEGPEDPVWSPDGSRILFDDGALGAVAWIDLVGGGGRLGTVGAGAFGRRPVWSPDGRQVVYARGKGFPEADKRLFVYDVATGAERQLIPSVTATAQPDYDDYDAALVRASTPAANAAAASSGGANAR